MNSLWNIIFLHVHKLQTTHILWPNFIAFYMKHLQITHLELRFSTDQTFVTLHPHILFPLVCWGAPECGIYL